MVVKLKSPVLTADAEDPKAHHSFFVQVRVTIPIQLLSCNRTICNEIIKNGYKKYIQGNINGHKPLGSCCVQKCKAGLILYQLLQPVCWWSKPIKPLPKTKLKVVGSSLLLLPKEN
jgi:hypothetical protein